MSVVLTDVSNPLAVVDSEEDYRQLAETSVNAKTNQQSQDYMDDQHQQLSDSNQSLS